MSKTVVVLGGAWGGLHVAHALLKNTKDTKVILVSTNSHFFENMASVRAIVPNTFTDKQLFFPLKDALSRYPSDRYELIIGSAEAVDTTAKTVKVSTGQSLSYDHLVVATGARNTPPPEAARAGALLPWKADTTYEDISTLLHSIQGKVAEAKTIVVAGGGSTGVEAAAELAFAYTKSGANVILLSSSAEILGGDDRVAPAGRSELKKLGVDVRTNAAVESSRVLSDGRVELTVAGANEPLVTDLYFATMGLTPNTDFLPKDLLSPATGGGVEVDEFYHAAGVASHDVWAAGDAVNKPRAGFMITQKQAAGVAKNIELALQGKPPVVVKLLPVDVLAVATGQSRGVGRINSFRMPSLMVWLAKGRTLGTNYLASYQDGSVA